MKIFWIFAAFVAFCAASDDDWYATVSFEGMEKWQKVFYWFLTARSTVVQARVEEHKLIADKFEAAVGINISNTTSLEVLSRKIAEAKTLKDLGNLAPGMPFGEFERYYRMIQRSAMTHGGYTSGFTYFECNYYLEKMLEDAIKDVPEPKKISDVVDLSTLTHIFEVTQVKYGSRWLAYIFLTPNQLELVKDPRKFAKDLYESDSVDDFIGKQTEVSGMTTSNWRVFYEQLIVNFKNIMADTFGIYSFRINTVLWPLGLGLEVLGDLGLLFF